MAELKSDVPDLSFDGIQLNLAAVYWRSNRITDHTGGTTENLIYSVVGLVGIYFGTCKIFQDLNHYCFVGAKIDSKIAVF